MKFAILAVLVALLLPACANRDVQQVVKAVSGVLKAEKSIREYAAEVHTKALGIVDASIPGTARHRSAIALTDFAGGIRYAEAEPSPSEASSLRVQLNSRLAELDLENATRDPQE